jgi:hypothetical protein
LRENVKLLDYAPWGTKLVIAFGIILGVNWKKDVPFTRRELPLAVGAIVVSTLSDYLMSDYIWKQHETDVIRLTGYKNGIYLSPQKMKAMRQSMSLKAPLEED